MNPCLVRVALIACVALLPVAARAQKQEDISLQILETFSLKRTSYTYAQAISNNDLVSGFYDQNPEHLETGFIRPRSGGTTKGIVFVPGAQTYLPGINSSGLAVGYKQDSDGQAAFFYQDGVITPYNFPGAKFTVLDGVNDAGDYTGYWSAGGYPLNNFASVGGNVISFVVPGSQFSVPQAINNLQEIVGWYSDFSGYLHGFIRRANGEFINPIDPEGSVQTQLYGVNDDGIVVGTFFDENVSAHGLVRQRGGQITQLDVSGAYDTAVQGINNERRICGFYYSPQGEASFIAQLLP